MSAPDEDRASRRRFLKQAGALVAAAPVVAALEATTSTAAAAAEAKKPAGDPFAAARPDLSILRNAEERAAFEKQWRNLQDVLAVIRKAPLDPSVEPAALFAALPRPPRDRRARDDDGDTNEED